MTNKAVEKDLIVKDKFKTTMDTQKTIYLNNNTKGKKQSKKSKAPLFCTECDKELDLFWLTDMASDKKAVKENHENCKEIGKFKGRYCSRMFISGVYTAKDFKVKK